MKISPEFLADFNRARSNGFLAQQAGKPFSPVFDPTVPGSQQLTVLPTFGFADQRHRHRPHPDQPGCGPGGLLRHEPRRRVRSATFMPNGGIYASQGIVNGAFTDYNALQVEVRRRFRGGLFGQLNYTLSDTNTDSGGTAQSRLEVFMDNARPELNTGRSQFHVTHVVSANAIFELPFGEGRRWVNRGGFLNQVVGGWQVASIVAWQSGSPFNFFSGRGTFNRPDGRTATHGSDQQLQPGSELAVRRRAQEAAGDLQSGKPHLLDRPEGDRRDHRPRGRRGQPDQHRRVCRTGVLQSRSRRRGQPAEPRI